MFLLWSVFVLRITNLVLMVSFFSIGIANCNNDPIFYKSDKKSATECFSIQVLCESQLEQCKRQNAADLRVCADPHLACSNYVNDCLKKTK